MSDIHENHLPFEFIVDLKHNGHKSYYIAKAEIQKSLELILLLKTNLIQYITTANQL